MTNHSFDLLINNCKKALVIGIGGGGDVIGSIPTAYYIKKILRKEVILGSLTWERWFVDPSPGPRSLEELEDIEILSCSTGLASFSTKIRGRNFLQASYVAEVLNEKVLLVDITGGVVNVLKGLLNTLKQLDIDLVVGVDVGGDVIARGNEQGLRSPLADSLMLAVLAKLKTDYKISSIVGFFGFGSDGELKQEEILKYLSEIAANGGYIGAKGLSFEEVEIMEKIMIKAITEASKIPVDAFKGVFGERTIRKGKRQVFQSILSTLTFYLAPEVVFKLSPLAQAIKDSTSLKNANKQLHDIGVKMTELDYEIEMEKQQNKKEKNFS